jgi:hypothetical protein
MRRTGNARIFLAGVLALPIGWWLMSHIGGRAAKEEYRNDEDFYTFLALCGALLLLLGISLIVIAVFRGLRKIDELTGPTP